MPRPRLGVIAAWVLLLSGCSGGAPAADVHIRDIHGLALDPDQPSRLYVATHHGLFVAENDTRWAAVTQEPFDMMGFTMHARDGRIMYASGHPNRAGQGWAVGVVKSVDAGRTWTTLALKNEVDFHAMTMETGTDNGPDTVYGFHGGKVHVSRDGGITWTSKATSLGVTGLAVDPASGDLLAATDQGLQRIGRGLTGEWEQVAPSEAVGVAAVDGMLLAYFADVGLSKSLDEGTTWIALNWTVPVQDYPWGIAAQAESGLVYAATARGSIFKTVDGGAAWTKIR